MKRIFDEEIEEMKKDALDDPAVKLFRAFVDLPLIDQLLLVTMYGILFFLSLANDPIVDEETKRLWVKAIFAGFR